VNEQNKKENVREEIDHADESMKAAKPSNEYKASVVSHKYLQQNVISTLVKTRGEI
jgi:hypothetical protein